MSDMERNKGKLIPHFKANEMQEDHLEAWLEENYGDFTLMGDTVYKVKWEVKRDTDTPDFFAEVAENPDGSIDFHTYHYNGGAHWTEVVEEALNRD